MGVTGFNFVLFTLISLSTFCGQPAYAQTAKERLRAIARADWIAVSQEQESESVTLIEHEEGAQEQLQRCLSIDSEGGNWIVTELSSPEQPTSDSLKAWGRNDRYAFMVKRTSKDSAWQLAYLGPMDSPMGIEGEPPSLLKAAWSIYGIPILTLVESENCQVTEFSESSGKDGTLSFAFECTGSHARWSEISRLRKGEVKLLPEAKFAVGEYRVVIGTEGGEKSGQGSVLVHNSFADSQGALAIDASEYQLEYYRDGKRQRKVWTTRFVKRSDCTRTPEGFYLAHFGIPEPKRESTGFTWIVAALVGGLILLVIARSLIKNAQ